MVSDLVAEQLMATFVEEVEEHVRVLNREALGLEKEPAAPERTERLATLLRTAHSLKGAARAVNVRLIEQACHRVEETLQGARDGRLPAGGDLCSLLLALADALEDAGARLRARTTLEESPLASLLPRLEAGSHGPVPAARGAPPSSLPGAPPSASAGPGFVRVRADRLDALLARTGEVLVARRSIDARHADLAGLREAVGRCRAEWRMVEKTLASVLEQTGETGPLARRAAQLSTRSAERIRRLEEDLDRLALAMAADGRVLKQTAALLDEDVRRARMLPFADACSGLERMVRDLAHAEGKEVELQVVGGDVELDRSIVEGLKDPLRHLVRNAIDHGIEGAAERQAAGKPARARITLAAGPRGAAVQVVVADDGRGFDLAALRERALTKGLPVPVDEREVARLAFEPGLSTAPIITDVSGRGVGLDVVKSEMEAMQGTVDVATTAGGGTRFTLTAPLTLTTLHALLIEVGGQTYALASAHVGELRRIGPEDVRPVQGRPMLSVGETLVPLTGLAQSLDPGGPAAAETDDGRKVPVVIVVAGEQRAAFVVDELLAEQEIVVKSLGARLRRVRAVSGATVLPSGCIALVLNAGHVVRTALRGPSSGGPPVLGRRAPAAKKRILLADDSITTRSLEKSLLEAAGYEVIVAVDGEGAWRALQEQGADVLVSDVEMPRMDGFALTEAVRGSARFRELPVVLVTGMERDQDKARGLEVGANAYLVKSAFDQRAFLATIAQLL